MDSFNRLMEAANSFLWHDSVLFVILGTGLLFTLWSGFSQYRALTHGFHVLRGRYDDPSDPGAISHFQALSAALSATVGLGNIGGVALAISLGGPGAIFWMWIVGAVGMAIKLTEVTLAMLYRNIDDPKNPHGGPMWVASKGLAQLNPGLAGVGRGIGVVFCLTLLVSTMTGGNMFQAWNVGEITEQYFGVPSIFTGSLLAVTVGSVILGGIQRIGAVAGRLVPFMVALYLVAGTYVLIVHITEIPSMLALIVTSAFSPAEADKAFIGGSAAAAFLFGMKRALFSNEAGQGSSPIAHAAARCREPVREAVVAGLEPFIEWAGFESTERPALRDRRVFETLVGATLTARAFDSVTPGLGKWLVTLASWLFAFSTMISWSYYGEQGMVYLAGERSVLGYKIVYCLLAVVATSGFLKTDAQLDNLTGIGTGVMLFVNLPILLYLGHQAMLAYRDYIQRLKDGRMGAGHAPPTLEDLISGRDVDR
jgi:amino acid carrier protein